MSKGSILADNPPLRLPHQPLHPAPLQGIRLFCDGAAKESRKQIVAVQAAPDASEVSKDVYDPARSN